MQTNGKPGVRVHVGYAYGAYWMATASATFYIKRIIMMTTSKLAFEFWSQLTSICMKLQNVAALRELNS